MQKMRRVVPDFLNSDFVKVAHIAVKISNGIGRLNPSKIDVTPCFNVTMYLPWAASRVPLQNGKALTSGPGVARIITRCLKRTMVKEYWVVLEAL